MKIDQTNTIPKLTGMTDDEIIQTILDTVKYRETMNITVDGWAPPQLADENITVKEWLKLVGYDEIKHEQEQDHYKIGQLRVASAGRSLNLKMLEDEGVEDYIGTNFPEWKNSNKYRPYSDDVLNMCQIKNQPSLRNYLKDVVKLRS